MERRSRLRRILWGLAIAVIASPLILLFNYVGRPELARPACFALMMILVAVKVCWELHSRSWFWITIIAIATLHVPLVLLTAQRLFRTPFSIMFFFGIADFVLIVAIIGLIERLIGRKDAHFLQNKSV